MTLAKENLVQEVLEISRHRNGICGEPFHVVKFRTLIHGESKPRIFIATVFDDSNYCAVLDFNLAKKTINHWQNAWRGDYFEEDLRREIKKWDKELSKKFRDECKKRNIG